MNWCWATRASRAAEIVAALHAESWGSTASYCFVCKRVVHVSVPLAHRDCSRLGPQINAMMARRKE